LWDGVPRQTNFISDKEIYVVADARDLNATATHAITVFNAHPGGGTSEPSTFVVTAQDFIVRPSLQTLTLKLGASSVVGVNLEPAPVFRGEISLSCSGLPAGLQCGCTPSTATPGTAPVVVAMTISNAQQARIHQPNGRSPHKSQWEQAALSLFAIVIFAGVVSAGNRRKGTFVALTLGAVLAALSCGGGSSTASTTAAWQPPVSSVQAIPVVITATGGGITHTQTLTLLYTK